MVKGIGNLGQRGQITQGLVVHGKKFGFRAMGNGKTIRWWRRKDDGDTGDEREASDRKLLQESRREGNCSLDHRGRSGGGKKWSGSGML